MDMFARVEECLIFWTRAVVALYVTVTLSVS